MCVAEIHTGGGGKKSTHFAERDIKVSGGDGGGGGEEYLSGQGRHD